MIFLGTLLFFSCSRTKDKAVNRYYHKLTSRYNPLYNGNKAYENAILSLKEEHADDFDQIIAVKPFGKSNEGSRSFSDLKVAIEKSKKIIRDHSMVFRGVQKNPIVFDAYLLLGDAQALMGLNIAAQESFAVVIRNAEKTARAYRAELSKVEVLADQGNGQAVKDALDEIERKGIPEKFVPKMNILRARSMLSEGDKEDAARTFEKSAKLMKNKAMKSRLAFIAGQLYETLGKTSRARESYQICLSGQPDSYDMLLEANLRKALNANSKRQDLYKELERLLKEPKNKQYGDRIYFALAEVAKKRKDVDQQLYFLSRGIGLGISERFNLKALAYYDRGEIYFKQKKYPPSQVNYDSAYILLPKNHPLKRILRNKTKGLNSLVAEIEKIQRNDSLLSLSSKSETFLEAYFLKYIEALKDQERIAIKNAEISALNAKIQASSNLLSASGPKAGGVISGGWVFYNPVARAAGIASFSSKWGQRPNVDNWRLQSASGSWSMATNGGPNSQAAELSNDVIDFVDPKYDLNIYLSSIPRTVRSQDSCKRIICNALSASSSIYRDQIGDLDMALLQINRLISFCEDDSSCVECEKQAYALYALYRLRLLRNENTEAESTKIRLLKEYPKSKYVKIINGQDSKESIEPITSKEFHRLIKLYDNRDWKPLIKLHQETLWNPDEAPQAALIEAHAIGGDGGVQKYLEALIKVEKNFPGTAQSVAAGNIKMALQSVKSSKENEPSPYSESLDIRHQLLIILSKEGNPNNVRNALARFHQKYFTGKPMSIRPLPLGEIAQIILVDGFKNASETMGYRTKVMRADGVTQFLKPYSAEYWPVTVQNFSHFYTEKDIKGYRSFVKNVYGLK